MNNNIFSPKGKIGQSSFIINYIILEAIFFSIGFLLFPIAIKYNWHSMYMNVILTIVNIFVMFNYKKRLMDISNWLIPSCILGFILTFDHILLAFLHIIEWKYIDIVFFVFLFVVFVIQPAIVAAIPGKKIEQ